MQLRQILHGDGSATKQLLETTNLNYMKWNLNFKVSSNIDGNSYWLNNGLLLAS